ncbi:MAG: hypothetical protein Q8R48_04035, partial [Candidatus Omnitrophota bacterium]|nr:hypothetical protein [Candidatus Omnitrophota bacterium]
MFSRLGQCLLPHSIGVLAGRRNTDFTDRFVPDAQMRAYSAPEAEERERLNQRREEAIQRRNALRDSGQPTAAVDVENDIIDSAVEIYADISTRPLNERLLEEAMRLRRQDPSRLLVVGIYGPTSTGKTTFTRFIIENMAVSMDDVNEQGEARGIRENYLSSDSYLHPGDGFRYVKYTREGRETRLGALTGQGIYDLEFLLRDIRDLRAGRNIETPWDAHAPGYSKEKEGKNRTIEGTKLEVLVLDLTCLGINEDIAKEVDILIPIVFDDDTVRLRRRLERDCRLKGEKGAKRCLTPEYVLNEFTEKQFEEVWDLMRFIMLDFGDMVWVQDTNF